MGHEKIATGDKTFGAQCSIGFGQMNFDPVRGGVDANHHEPNGGPATMTVLHRLLEGVEHISGRISGRFIIGTMGRTTFMGMVHRRIMIGNNLEVA